MNSIDTPWSGMRTPASGRLSTLRVPVDSVKPWYWIKSEGGYYGVAIQLNANEGGVAVNIRGTKKIQIIRVDDSNEDHYLGVVINSSELATVFHRLCLDLVQACNYADTTNQILGILKRRVAAWQRLFEKGGQRLSPEKCLGLISEMKFLTEHWIPRLSASGVIGWFGPTGGAQDFKDVTKNIAVEIKSHGVQSDVIKIASKEQLDYDGQLFLVAYPGALSSDEAALTLNQYVEEAKAKVPPNHYPLFEERIMEAGYIYDTYYDELRFILGEPTVYRVGEEFPKLTSETLPSAIRSIRYDLSLSSIAEWNCSMTEIKNKG
ncbi:PD-(D/E)XK motif protein [Pseudidiomarina sp. YC-516-91]|uniref:PD-(D/E)XK motif protein n=1 Tax=Pseudidiomarina salilacus TaxID=3384452 RepID=UPI003984E467